MQPIGGEQVISKANAMPLIMGANMHLQKMGGCGSASHADPAQLAPVGRRGRGVAQGCDPRKGNEDCAGGRRRLANAVTPIVITGKRPSRKAESRPCMEDWAGVPGP